MVASIITSGQIAHWLANARGGESVVYARGHVLPAHCAEGMTLLRLAYNGGRIELCQRRTAAGDFEYIAQMRRKQVKREVGTGFPPEILMRASK